MKKKRIVVFAIIIIFIISPVCTILGMKIYYAGFFDSATREFEIPGTYENFVPQGFCHLPEYSVFLISGYDNKTQIAKICKVSQNGTDTSMSWTEIRNENGSPFLCHAGGVSVYGDNVFIAGTDLCYVLPLDDILNESGSVEIAGSFNTYNNSAFCTVYNDRLYVGEYHYNIKYDTDETHHLPAPAGEENPAVITIFQLGEQTLPPVSESPEGIISIPGRIQGMCFDETGGMILSASSLVSPSQLYCYDFEAMKRNAETFSFGGNEIPLYFADNSTLTKTIELPPKAEGIVYKDGQVFFINEAASGRFLFGRFLGLEYVYSIDGQQAVNPLI